MKQFRVPCLFGLAGKQPFPIYVGEPNPENHPLKYQADWLRRERGGSMPRSVMESLRRLQQIALRSHVSFEDLCAYAIGQGPPKRMPAPTLAEARRIKAAAAPETNGETAARLPLQVIHNPGWEEHVRRQDDERAKLPHLQLVAQRATPTAEISADLPALGPPARKPRPGVDFDPQRPQAGIAEDETERYPFRHLYDWLRGKPAVGFAEIQALTSVLLPAELEEEQLLLSTLMLEETQSVLLPHSFGETLDFLFHYDDLHYSFAVVLDAGAQYLSRSTYGNILHFYQMPAGRFAGMRQSLNRALHGFATTLEIPPQQRAHAPEGFDLAEFHRRCAQWFLAHPQQA